MLEQHDKPEPLTTESTKEQRGKEWLGNLAIGRSNLIRIDRVAVAALALVNSESNPEPP
jgi:hypothetical protein